MRGIRQRNAAHIHTQQASHYVDGQSQNRHDREHKNTAVGFFSGVGGEFFLKQFGPLLERSDVIQDSR